MFQASDATKPIPLGELFKHRPAEGGHFEVPDCLPDTNGCGSKATRGVVGVLGKRTKQEHNSIDLSLTQSGLFHQARITQQTAAVNRSQF
jgi:hypothetical protein